MRRTAFAAGLALLALPALAQVPVITPGPSPHASAGETIAVTEVAVTYSRPGVKGRKIWGGLVPYGEVWRTGANENTVVSFSTPVKVEGQSLPAGKYGLHAIPTESSWTVIFSRESGAWGSFSYDPKEDALRVTVTPQPSEFVERLLYTFDDLKDDAATLSLRWEKLRVPVRIEVDRVATVTANLAEQLRGLPRFGWLGWNQAAQWLAMNGGDLALATTWVDKSIALQENGANLMTKATIVEKQGDAKAAAELRTKADEIATEAQRNNLGYQYLAAGQVDLAIATFQKNAKAFPNSWNVWDSLAEGYATKGDKKAAIENYTKALGMVKDPVQKKRIEGELAKLR
jgi:TolA-binding protein